MTEVPVLEIGGSHVTAAVVDPDRGVVLRHARGALLSGAGADPILDAIAAVARRVGARPGARWGVALPGPFDYAKGIGRYAGVGKFDALNGVDVGAELCRRIEPPPGAVRFLGDAVAFGLGEWAYGAARGHERAAAVTLGTGVGSAFIRAGVPVTDGPLVPPEGRADLLTIAGRPLEETVSTRAIVAAYHVAGGEPCDAAAGVAARAAGGDTRALQVLEVAYRALGRAMAPWLTGFGASVLVVGGGISAAWDLIAPPLEDGLSAGGAPGMAVVRSGDTETSALLGAARYVTAD